MSLILIVCLCRMKAALPVWWWAEPAETSWHLSGHRRHLVVFFTVCV